MSDIGSEGDNPQGLATFDPMDDPNYRAVLRRSVDASRRARGRPPFPCPDGVVHTVPGARGYGERASDLSRTYEAMTFEEVHGGVAGLVPPEQEDILDVGAGSGRDAAHLASLGHRVLAVEPVRAFRDIAARLHPGPGVEWMDDALPDLDRVVGTGRRFGLVMASAVWMHLDPGERARAMPRLASLLKPGGRLYVLTRHGPPPPGRVMHEVDDAETADLARSAGLDSVASSRIEDRLGRAGISWSALVASDPRPAPDGPLEDGDQPSPAPGR